MSQQQSKHEIFDVDADVSFSQSSMIADYSVIERNMEEARINEPTLPCGRVIDCKNTMQSYDFPIDSSTTTAVTNHVSNRFAFARMKRHSETTSNAMEDTCASNSNDVQDIHAVAIVEGKLYTESVDSPRRIKATWWVVGVLVIVCAIVVTGVCASGNCSAKSGNPPQASNFTVPPTDPTEAPIEVSVAQAVSSFVNQISFLEEEILVNGTTPESQALTWLVEKDTLFNSTALLTLDAKFETEVSFRVRQRYPLLTLWYQKSVKDSVFVRSWANTLGWLEYGNECDWFGIKCTSYNLGGNIGVQEVVTEIDFFNDDVLTSNDYFGSIPPDIGLLTSLRSFDLKSNRVTGLLPESVGNCRQIQRLDLSDCLMVGTLPSSLGDLTGLLHLDVKANGFFGTIPPNSERWLNLTHFNVNSNGLSGSLPSYIGKWTALTRLDLYENLLTSTIPQSVGLLTNLIYLDLGSNKLRGTLPSSIGELVNLTTLDVSQNFFTGTIPPSLGNLSQINFASFFSNQFIGTLPPQICNNTDPATDYVFGSCMLSCDCCRPLENCTGTR